MTSALKMHFQDLGHSFSCQFQNHLLNVYTSREQIVNQEGRNNVYERFHYNYRAVDAFHHSSHAFILSFTFVDIA